MPRRMRMYPGRATSSGASFAQSGKNANLTYTPNSGGTTYNAASLAPSDIQAAINLATTGDTVQLPAGSRTYVNGDNITCTKAIRIKGAGGGRVEGRSTSSLAIGTGSKSWTVVSDTVVSARNSYGPGFTVGETIRAVYVGDGTNYMEGTVTSWSGGTLTLNVTTTGGSGTHATWTFVAAPATTLIHTSTTTDLFTLTKSSAGLMEICDLMVSKTTTTTKAAFRVDDNASWTGRPVMFHDMRSTMPSPITQVDTVYASCNGLIMWRVYCDNGFYIHPTSGTLNDHRLITVKNFDPDNWGWNRPDTMGSADSTGEVNSYMEDCFIDGCGLTTDWDDNARGVERYNVLNNSGTASHGPDTSFHGVQYIERYNIKCFYDSAMTGGAATGNLQVFFEWRGGSGVLYDCEIPDITSGWWGDKGEVKCQMQMLQRASGPFGPWGKYSGAVEGNFSALVSAGGRTAYPVPRQCGMSHPSSGNVTTDVKATSITKSTFYVTGATHTPDARSGDTSTLTGVDTNTNPCYMGNYSPIYQSGCTGTGNYTSISGENYSTPGTTYADGADYFNSGAAANTSAGTLWVNGSKPGYSKYTYPHPLRTN